MALTGTADALPPERSAAGREYIQSRARTLLDWLVALWVFSGCFVITEPAPYEVVFLAVFGVALFAGQGLHRGTLGLLLIFALFIPFALIAAFQVKFMPVSDALLFTIVTIFLFFTAYFVANYVADAPVRRMKLIVGAYVAAAVLSALVGTLGYLELIPGDDLFTRYGRAKAFFNDPNVFGPFLMLPAMFVLQDVLLKRGRPAWFAAIFFGIIFIGVFASFSRAAWGHLLASALIVFCLIWMFEAHARTQVRMLMLSLFGALALVVAIVGLLSIPAVNRLFEIRATTQSYDEGESGRFGRQGYAFELALEHPWGLGPLEFRNLRVKEEPHNSYVNVLHAYGWGGGMMFYGFIIVTLWRGFKGLARPGPNRLYLIPLVATFLPLSVEAAIIDVDHWRHFFLVGGLIWGVTAGYWTSRQEPRTARA
jgi:O-antigen ligase